MKLRPSTALTEVRSKIHLGFHDIFLVDDVPITKDDEKEIKVSDILKGSSLYISCKELAKEEAKEANG